VELVRNLLDCSNPPSHHQGGERKKGLGNVGGGEAGQGGGGKEGKTKGERPLGACFKNPSVLFIFRLKILGDEGFAFVHLPSCPVSFRGVL
jgi:hypothetical protein